MRAPNVCVKGLAPLIATGSLCAAALLAGCPSAAYVGRSPAPVAITGFVETGRFPLQLGPYRRGKIVLYEPGMTNYSIAYDRFDADLQNAVTLYFYPRARRMDEQFSAEKLAVLRAHPGAVLLGERRALVWNKGYSFEAFIASFEFDGELARREQRISSLLVLVALPDRSFKVRSSAPAAQAASAEASMFDLLEKMDWAK